MCCNFSRILYCVVSQKPSGREVLSNLEGGQTHDRISGHFQQQREPPEGVPGQSPHTPGETGYTCTVHKTGSLQVAKHTRQIEEKNSELRELKVELDKERMEKQFLAEENTRIKNERRRLEADKSDLQIRVRDLTDGCRSHDNSAVDSELSDQYHTLLQVSVHMYCTLNRLLL